MEMEQALTSSRIYSEEEETLSTVYSSFDKTIAEQTAEYISAKSYALSGNYEEQDTFIHYGTASRIGKKKFATARLISDLKSSPYFAHILIKDEDNDEQIHCLMSDSETLDHMIQIHAKEQTMILPFKQEKGKEIYNQLFHLYQDKSGKRFKADAFTYQPIFIRNDDIFEQQLQSATQLYPAVEIKDEEIVDCDELLTRKLKENRRNSALSNIIATLQRQQYNIIQTPADKSFIVQGCAGSGKSQCLIHRLFFLRDVYAKEWEKVLLITPTQLFRNYSADLMKRYRLTGINNTSIADFYHEILNRIDPRFKNRQYKYELSEEYLPDEYLNQVYSETNILKIKGEIIAAIRKHVRSACEILGTEYNEDLISRKNIDALDERIKNEIAEFDLRESTLAQDSELIKARKRIDEISKRVTQLRNAQENLNKKLQDLSAEKDKFDRLCASLESAESEKKEWEKNLDTEISNLKAEILRLSDKMVYSSPLSHFPNFKQYFDKLYSYLDYFNESGIKKKEIDDFRVFLNDYVLLCEDELKQFTGGISIEEWLTDFEKQRNQLNDNIKSNQESLTENETELDNITDWLAQHMEDSKYRNQNSQLRAQLEREHYYLSRIESSVFEQEIWNALAPLKEQCGIKTLEINLAKNGRNKETRILYKSDLLFYLHIYFTLGEFNDIPDYKLICIDEGQDLHKADYEMLKQIFPKATYNIFGDIAQSLHEKCGITDWKTETGIDLLFTLDSNYRNPAGIVDFCNTQFGEKMKYCGTIEEDADAIPLSLSSIMNIVKRRKTTFIVKDKEAFDHLCSIIGSQCRLNYIDTKSSGEKVNMLSCYSIYAAKGLEFQNVIVLPERMNHNQKVVACTRAMESLFYLNSDSEA